MLRNRLGGAQGGRSKFSRRSVSGMLRQMKHSSTWSTLSSASGILIDIKRVLRERSACYEITQFPGWTPHNKQKQQAQHSLIRIEAGPIKNPGRDGFKTIRRGIATIGSL